MGELDEASIGRPPLGHVRLFRKEILESGVIDLGFIRSRSFLGQGVVEKLEALYNRDRPRAIKMFYRTVVHRYPKESMIFYDILMILFREETSVQNELSMRHVNPSAKKRYLELFKKDGQLTDENCTGDIVSSVLKAQPFIERLKEKYAKKYEGMIKNVETLLRERYHDAAACLILRQMPSCSTIGDEDDSWWFHFLDICDCDPGNRALLKLLDSNFRQTIDEFRKRQRIRNSPQLGLELFNAEIKDEDRKFRPQADYVKYRERLPYDRIQDPEEIELRDYQKELLSKVNGRNTIICAPTGSGKTILAAQLILDHFEKKRKECKQEMGRTDHRESVDSGAVDVGSSVKSMSQVDEDRATTISLTSEEEDRASTIALTSEEEEKEEEEEDEYSSLDEYEDVPLAKEEDTWVADEAWEEVGVWDEVRPMPTNNEIRLANVPARVVMIVPTIPLVGQQAQALCKYMRKKYYVHESSGAQSCDSPGCTILSADVTVVTPQMFYNLLTDPRESERLYISDFTMFIFDECHHCDGDHPYMNVMRLVRKFGGATPHIIGMTASVGVGFNKSKSKDIYDARDHMITMCAKLTASSIATVRQHIDSLREHVGIPDEQIITVDRKETTIRSKLVELVKVFEGHVAKRLQKTPIFGRHEKVRTFPDISKIAVYTGFLSEMENRVTTNSPHEVQEKNALLEAIKRVKLFYEILNLADLLPIGLVMDMHNLTKFKNCDNLQEEQEEHVKGLLELLRDESNLKEDLEKGMLRELMNILKKEYKREGETRTLIFVTTRCLADKLAHHLNQRWNECQMPEHDLRYEPVAFITSKSWV
uniref:Helicase ATP-binding domain-containing protein n=1 Tax=Steinernema glaseri TaxID=37863 RepID=A0A1I8A5V3_9BILA